MLEDIKQHIKTVGMKQTMKAVEANRAQAVYIAKDADERLVSKLIDICREKNVKVYWADSMKLLGKACSIDVGTAVVAVISDQK